MAVYDLEVSYMVAKHYPCPPAVKVVKGKLVGQILGKKHPQHFRKPD
jgi:hypothetical protein